MLKFFMISTFAQHTQSQYMYSISKLNIQFILPGDWNAWRLECWEIGILGDFECNYDPIGRK